MIDYSGLQVCRYLPNRALVVLMLMHYVDSDLGQYYEYGTNVMVNPPGSNASGLARPAVGGRLHPSHARRPGVHAGGGPDDLGLPEGDGGLHGVATGRQFGFDVSIDGQLAVSMEFRPGLPVPSRFTGEQAGAFHLLAPRRRHP